MVSTLISRGLRVAALFSDPIVLFYQRPDQYHAHNQVEGRGIQTGEISARNYGKDEVCYGVGQAGS